MDQEQFTCACLLFNNKQRGGGIMEIRGRFGDIPDDGRNSLNI